MDIHLHVGQIIKLVPLRKRPQLSGARLAAAENERSYGILRDDAGREVFFSHDLFAGSQGFDDLRRGQLVEFTFDDPFLRAASIHPLMNRPLAVPAAD